MWNENEKISNNNINNTKYKSQLEPDRGRILIFQIEKEGINYKIKLVYQKEVLGSVYSALAFDEKLLVGVDGKVFILSFIWLENSNNNNNNSW